MNSIYSLVILSFLQCYLLIEKSCAERINVTATVGENVTLRVPERRIIQIIDVTWVTRGWYHFVTTAPGGNVVIRDAHYKGRLRCSNDASLTITNVTLEDQGRYTASILLSDGDTYGQIYHIRMLDKKSFLWEVPIYPKVNKSAVSFTQTLDSWRHEGSWREQDTSFPQL
ncbi:pregnancy-specific beta-1-glycoprotein 3-like isoform X2 [Mixophyes fleayi]|uniref:pregnancy-specific beta-1-glycoprotein 3-like isoform X2 n=1 Tax=Mixophyes fleayi TaxID=3061075 RepID=UPI003F4DED25